MRAALPLLVLVAALLAHAAHATLHGDWLIDDAGITFAYARHLADGLGPVTYPGGPVEEGYSNPAWTFLLAGLIKLGLFEPFGVPKALSLVFVGLGALASGDLVRRISGWRVAAALPAAWLALNGSFVAWSVGGLENAQYVGCLLVALAVYARDLDRPDAVPRAGPWLFVVTISRPEGAVYALAVGFDALVRALRAMRTDASSRAWRWLAGLVAGGALPLGAYLLWHHLTFGWLLPNTYLAKARSAPFLERLLDPSSSGWRYLLDGLWTWWQAPLIALAVLGAWLTWRRDLDRGLLAMWGSLAGSVLFVLQSGGDWMMGFRFMSTTYALIALLAAIGLAAVADAITLRMVAGRPTRGGVWADGVELALAVPLTVALALPAPAGARALAETATVPFKTRLGRLPRLVAIAESLGEPRPDLLMSDMGGPMWTNDRGLRVDDMFGLCTRSIAQKLHDGEVEAMWEEAFVGLRPALIQFPPTLAKRWMTAVSADLHLGWRHLDDAAQPRSAAGYYLRRDLIEPDWDPAYADGEVQVQGEVRVHRLDVTRGPAGLQAEVVFSLAAPPARVPMLQLTDGVRSAPLPLLPGVPRKGLRADEAYIARGPLALPRATRPDAVRVADASPAPSPLRPRPARVPHPITVSDAADLAAEGWFVQPREAVTAGGAVTLSATVDAGAGPAVACTPPAPYVSHPDVPTTAHITWSAERLDGTLLLEARFLDARSKPVGRARLRSPDLPLPARRGHFLLEGPESARKVRLCLVVSSGTVRAALHEVVVSTPAAAR